MKKQDFIMRVCEGWDRQEKKCKYGHNPNGGYLCEGNEVFNLYEEGSESVYNIRLPDCVEE